MGEPTEGDYQQVMRKIEQFDKQLDEEQVEESIDLEEIVNGKEEEDEEESGTKDEEVYLESLSASELKKRNAFIT